MAPQVMKSTSCGRYKNFNKVRVKTTQLEPHRKIQNEATVGRSKRFGR